METNTEIMESEIIEIKSLADFIEKLPSDEQKKDNVYLYRGHSDSAFELQPTAYRKNKSGNDFREQEYDLYQEMLLSSPSEFANDPDVFSRLVRMQHHGLPTRLFDVTQNPLVALYFASQPKDSPKNYCLKDDCPKKNKVEEEKFGEVLLFEPKKDELKFSSQIADEALWGLNHKIDMPFYRKDGVCYFKNYLNKNDFFHRLLTR